MNFCAILVFLVSLKIDKKNFRLCALLVFIVSLLSLSLLYFEIIKPAREFIYDLIPALLAGELVAFVILALLAYVILIASKSLRVLREVATLAKLAFSAKKNRMLVAQR